jgi:tellurite methyltransferase
MNDNEESPHASAHVFWDSQWNDPEARKGWEIADGRIQKSLESMLSRHPGSVERKKIKILDIGCGAGRHALLLSDAGFDVYACDASEASVTLVDGALSQRGMEDRVLKAGMAALPYESETFDWVIAWNVLYHGSFFDLVTATGEVRRVLKKGGRFEGTFISKRNAHFGGGISIDEHTRTDDTGSDKSHPHCYSSRENLETLLSGFKILELEEYLQKNYAEAWHWYLASVKETK